MDTQQLKEELKTWIRRVTMLDRTHNEGYQIICDDVYPFISRIEAVKNRPQNLEKVLGMLYYGTRCCTTWVSVSNAMNYFALLKESINKL